MRLMSGFVGCGAILAGLAGAWAAPGAATPDEATAIRVALERYVGHGVGSSGPVTVTPQGDHYTVAIDLKAALHSVETLGIQLEPATYSFSATPSDTGLWHVADLVVPKLTFKHKDQSYGIVLNNPHFDGMFDPRIPAFQSSSFTYDSMSVAAVGPQNDMQTRSVEQGRQTSMATPTGDGTADLQLSHASGAFKQDVDAATVGVAAGPKGSFSLTGTATTGSIAFAELHSRALTDAWTFVVAHPDDAAMKAAQEDLRAILRRAVPLFDSWTQSGESRGLTVASPYGTFKADTFGGRMKLSGLVDEGFAESELHFAGLTIPEGLLPGWASGFIPTSASLAERFTGYHLGAAARQAVDAFDLSANPPFTPQVRDSLKASLGPIDKMVVILQPSHLGSRLLNVDFDGEVHLHETVPDFTIRIHAGGLDAALQELQSKSAGDPSASQVAAVLILAKGLGKAEPDGRLSWIVARSADGNITVNGLTLPGTTK